MRDTHNPAQPNPAERGPSYHRDPIIFVLDQPPAKILAEEITAPETAGNEAAPLFLARKYGVSLLKTPPFAFSTQKNREKKRWETRQRKLRLPP